MFYIHVCTCNDTLILKSLFQIHDHYKGHKEWFKLINNQEWSSNGKYKDINPVDCPVSEEK